MALTEHTVNTPAEAVAWLATCTLATVIELASMARIQKGELSRQVSIAQRAISHLDGMRDKTFMGRDSRVDAVLISGSVRDWLKSKAPKGAAALESYEAKYPARSPAPFKSTEECQIYLIDCTLATVEYYLEMSNPPRSRLSRQMGIARKGLRHLTSEGLDLALQGGSRVASVLRCGSVETWVCEKQIDLNIEDSGIGF